MLAAKPPALTAYLRIMAYSIMEMKTSSMHASSQTSSTAYLRIMAYFTRERKTNSMHASSQTSSFGSLPENNGVLNQGEEDQQHAC